MTAEPEWHRFDSEAYLSHYYEELHPDDIRLARLTARAFADRYAVGAKLDVLDVGTGPNLFPLLCASPFAAHQTAWEYSASNVDWLRSELKRPELRPLWQDYLDIIGDELGVVVSSGESLGERTSVEQQSIFDLPHGQWDAATMFFCAESITSSTEEFHQACACYAGAVRTGGLLAGAFLARSEGYVVAGRNYPAVSINSTSLYEAFAPVASEIEVVEVGGTAEQTHSGYSGALFLTARAN